MNLHKKSVPNPQSGNLERIMQLQFTDNYRGIKMKRIIVGFAISMMIATNAYAAIWSLVKSDTIDGKWYCTYQYEGYQTTIIVTSGFCPNNINK